MTTERVVLASLSAAMDGGFTAIADVSKAMTAAGAADDYRLIGGVTVMRCRARPAPGASAAQPRSASTRRMSTTARAVPRTVPVTFERPMRGR